MFDRHRIHNYCSCPCCSSKRLSWMRKLSDLRPQAQITIYIFKVGDVSPDKNPKKIRKVFVYDYSCASWTPLLYRCSTNKQRPVHHGRTRSSSERPHVFRIPSGASDWRCHHLSGAWREHKSNAAFAKQRNFCVAGAGSDKQTMFRHACQSESGPYLGHRAPLEQQPSSCPPGNPLPPSLQISLWWHAQ